MDAALGLDAPFGDAEAWVLTDDSGAEARAEQGAPISSDKATRACVAMTIGPTVQGLVDVLGAKSR